MRGIKMAENKPKIFVYCQPCESWGDGSVLGYAIAEDGCGLISHLSSNIDWSKHDMGITSNWHHDDYKEHYPEGYQLIWVDDPENDEELKTVWKLNEEVYQSKIKNKASVSITFCRD